MTKLIDAALKAISLICLLKKALTRLAQFVRDMWAGHRTGAEKEPAK